MKKSFLSCFSVRKHSQRCSTTTAANTTQKTGCMTHVRSYNAFLNTEKLSQYDRNYNQNIASKTCITVTHENIKSIMGCIDSRNGSAGYYALEKKNSQIYAVDILRLICRDWMIIEKKTVLISANGLVAAAERFFFFLIISMYVQKIVCHRI